MTIRYYSLVQDTWTSLRHDVSHPVTLEILRYWRGLAHDARSGFAIECWEEDV